MTSIEYYYGMNLLARDTDYAVRALRRMAQDPGMLMSVAELAPEIHVPRPYLRRILQTLARRKVLRSFRGKGGGFLLNARPDRIFLTDVIEIFQGQINLAHCVFRDKACPNCETCPLRRTVKDVEALALKRLRGVTIGSLL